MVFGITFKISSATISKTHIDKIIQGLTKIIQLSKNLNILPFQNSNSEANQNQPPNVQYINERDVTEQINMIRQHPKRNSSQIQPNNALTYQVFRTGCKTLLKYIKGDLFKSTDSLAHCVLADFAIQRGIAAEDVDKFPFLRNSALQFSSQPRTILAYWHEESQRFFYNLVTKVKCSDKPNPPNVANAIEAMREHSFSNNVKVIAMPRLASGLDGLPWNEIQTMLLDILWNSGIQIQVHYLPFSSQRPLSRPLRDNVSGVHSLYSLILNCLRLSNQNVKNSLTSIFTPQET